MAIQRETELYLPIKHYLESLGYSVKSEIKSCDVVAIRDEAEAPLIVELKKTFNLSLLLQGVNRLTMSDTVYLAVEHQKKTKGSSSPSWSEITKLCRMLGLGLLTVHFYKTKKPFVEVLCDPTPYIPRQSKKRISGLLYEFHERSGDYNIGGSTRRKLITSYREISLHCAYMLKQHSTLSPKQLREMTGSSKISGILQKNYYGWFKRVSRGIYQLTPSGEEALQMFSEVIDAKSLSIALDEPN